MNSPVHGKIKGLFGAKVRNDHPWPLGGWWRLGCHLSHLGEQQLQKGGYKTRTCSREAAGNPNITVLLFCSPLTWIEEKGPGLKRNRHLSFHFKSGSLENVPNVGDNRNIFLKDQTIFVQKLLGQISEVELAAEKKRILHCLWLAEEIQKCCGWKRKRKQRALATWNHSLMFIESWFYLYSCN